MILEIVIAAIMGLFGFNKLLNSKERVDRENKEKKLGIFKPKPKRIGWIAVIGSVAGIFAPKKRTPLQRFQDYTSEIRMPFSKPKKKSFWQKISGK